MQTQRLVALLLFRLEVHARRSVVHAAEARDGAFGEEEALGQGGLP
jgi:hypothetical protein